MNKTPIWILENTVLMIHEAQIAEHGGLAGVRDSGLLQSALSHPLNLFSYQQTTISELAAAYAERIIKNHPFMDGNKRTAYVVMRLFLKLNGFELVAEKKERAIKCIQLAASEISIEDFTAWLNAHLKPREEIVLPEGDTA